VKAVEIGMVVLCGALGIRSLIYWIRRPFEGRDARDHLLFALFVVAGGIRVLPLASAAYSAATNAIVSAWPPFQRTIDRS
jgi:hypothetical protein